MQRAPLGQINGNCRRGPDLSPYIRGKIITSHQLGLKPREISRQLQIKRILLRSIPPSNKISVATMAIPYHDLAVLELFWKEISNIFLLKLNMILLLSTKNYMI